MEKKEQLYEGKAKKVYATEDPNLVIVSYKDDATAFDGAKKGTIVGKGVINNQMTNRLMAKMEKAGIPTRLVAPHKAFNRRIGSLSGVRVSPEGRVVSEAEWQANVDRWLPSAEDRAFVASLMGRVVDPGKFANWIAPPVMGINRQPVDFEYVRFN